MTETKIDKKMIYVSAHIILECQTQISRKEYKKFLGGDAVPPYHFQIVIQSFSGTMQCFHEQYNVSITHQQGQKFTLFSLIFCGCRNLKNFARSLHQYGKVMARDFHKFSITRGF